MNNDPQVHAIDENGRHYTYYVCSLCGGKLVDLLKDGKKTGFFICELCEKIRQKIGDDDIFAWVTGLLENLVKKSTTPT